MTGQGRRVVPFGNPVQAWGMNEPLSSDDLPEGPARTLAEIAACVGLRVADAILDPPREEVIEAVKVAHNAGICVKMITGVTN